MYFDHVTMFLINGQEYWKNDLQKLTGLTGPFSELRGTILKSNGILKSCELRAFQKA